MAIEAARLAVRVDADTSNAESGLSGLASKLGMLGPVAGVAALGVGAAFAGVGVAIGGSVAAAAGFESTMSGVKAVSGATADEMKGLSGLALQLGKDTSFSASEAGKGIEELVKGGLSIADVMGGGAKAALDLAAAGSLSVADAAEIAANAVGQFGLKGGELSHVADMIAGAANASALDVTDFKFSMAAAGAVANTVGFSFDDLAVAIGELGKAGIKGSDAGTSLKTMFMRLVPSTKEAKNAMREYGLIAADGSNAFFDQTGKVKSLAEVQGLLAHATRNMSEEGKIAWMNTVFGSDAIRAAAVLAKEGTAGFNEMAESMGKVTAAAVGAERLNNLKGSMEQLKGSVETAAITVGMALTPALKSLVDVGTNLLNSAMPGIEAFATGLSETIKQVVDGFQFGAEGGVENLLQMLGFSEESAAGVTDFIKGVMSSVQQIIGGFQFGGLGGGVGNIIQAIFGLSEESTGEIVDQINNVVTQVSGALNSLMAIFSGGDKAGGELQLATIINEAFGPTSAKLVTDFVQSLEGIQAKIGDVIKAFHQGGIAGVIAKEFGGDALAAFWNFEKAVKSVAESVGTAATKFPELVAAIAGGVDAFTNNAAAMSGLKVAAEAAAIAYGAYLATQLLVNAQTIVLTATTTALTAAKSALAFATGTVAGQMGILGIAVLGATEALGYLYNNNTDVHNALVALDPKLAGTTEKMDGMTLAAKLTGDAFSILGGDADLVRIAVGNAFDAIGTAADKMVTEVAYALMQITNKIRDLAGSIGGMAAEVGKNLVQGFINGMDSLLGSARSKVTELGNLAAQALGLSLKEQSPSRVTHQHGQWFVEGFINGVGDMVGRAVNATEGLAQASIQAFLDAVREDGDVLNDWLADIPDQLKPEAFAAGLALARELGYGLSDPYGNIAQTAKDLGVTMSESVQDGWAESMAKFNPQTSFDFLDQRDFEHWQDQKKGLQPLWGAVTGPDSAWGAITPPGAGSAPQERGQAMGVPMQPVVVNIGLDNFKATQTAIVNMEQQRTTDSTRTRIRAAR